MKSLVGNILDSGNLRYYKERQDGYPRLLLTIKRSEDQDFTKEMYYQFLDKIDSFLTKKLTKKK